MSNESWFPKYKNEMLKGAMGNNFCSYLIALEGWRRGLKLTWSSRKVRQGIHAPGRAFSLSSDTKTHMFYKSRGDKVSSEAVKICADKGLTKKILHDNGIRIPQGREFLGDCSDEEIISYAKKIGFPLVIKPSNGNQGDGVISNIATLDYFKQSLTHIRYTLKYLDVIVEEYIEGEEYRFFVIEDDVIAVINRKPASVLGNGKDTIENLIRIKNNERKRNPRLSTCLIHIDYEIKNHLKSAGRTLSDIPSVGEEVSLRQISNISKGGDSYEVRDAIPKEIKDVAIRALKVLPDIPHGGVDIIIDSNKPIEKAGTVLEINGVPQIGSLVFPMVGEARDIPSAIIDYYFPETKNTESYNPKLYFDFRETLRPLRNKTASEISIVPAPTDVTTSILYVVKGKVQNVGYRRWVRKKALEFDLHGSAQNRNNGNVHVIVSGSEENIKSFKRVCAEGPDQAIVEEVHEREWNKSIKVGFEIKKSQKRKVQPKVKNKPLTFTQKLKKILKTFLK